MGTVAKDIKGETNERGFFGGGRGIVTIGDLTWGTGGEANVWGRGRGGEEAKKET